MLVVAKILDSPTTFKLHTTIFRGESPTRPQEVDNPPLCFKDLLSAGGDRCREPLPYKTRNLFGDVGWRIDPENRLPGQRVHGNALPFRSAVRLMEYHGIGAVQEFARGIFEVFRLGIEHRQV